MSINKHTFKQPLSDVLNFLYLNNMREALIELSRLVSKNVEKEESFKIPESFLDKYKIKIERAKGSYNISVSKGITLVSSIQDDIFN